MGLPGRRSEAIRAGITIMVFWFSIMDLGPGAANWTDPSYSYCGGREKQLVSAPDKGWQGAGDFMSSSIEFNKIAGAVLGTALMVFGLKSLAGIIYHSEKPEKPGYAIEVAQKGTETKP